MLSFDFRYARGSFELAAKAMVDAGVTGICGPSGSGKSTLLALLAGLLRPRTGVLRIDDDQLIDTGRNLFVPAWNRHFGLVFQDGQLFPHLSVRRNLLYGFDRLRPEERHFTLDAVKELLEIGHLLDRRPTLLSGGERIVAIVTHRSVQQLGLRKGVDAIALIKASSVIVAVGNGAPMKLSARNQLTGTISRIVAGAVNTEVVIDLAGGNSVAAIITRASATQMRLLEGKNAIAIFKASSVILAVPT